MPSVLSETEILLALVDGEIVVTPLVSTRQIGPTIDLRLGTEFIVKRMDSLTHFDPVLFHDLHSDDPEQINRYYEIVKRVEPTKPFVLHAGQFALGCTMEYVGLPSNIGGQLEGKSSWAREGLNVHSTAGLIHPGHSGVIVFELSNVGSHPIKLYPGIPVAQLLLYRLEGESIGYADRGDAKYSKNIATCIGRPWQEWEFEALSEAIALEAETQLAAAGTTRRELV